MYTFQLIFYSHGTFVLKVKVSLVHSHATPRQKCHIVRVIKKYFRQKALRIDISEIWNEVSLIRIKKNTDEIDKFCYSTHQ